MQWYKWLDSRFVGKSARVIAMKLPLDLGFAGPVYVSAVLCYTNLVRTGDPATCYPFWREVCIAPPCMATMPAPLLAASRVSSVALCRASCMHSASASVIPEHDCTHLNQLGGPLIA
jgi:hypothetical protein